MSEKINNLGDLRREKELLKLKIKVTQQAFIHSLSENRRQVHRLVVNKIAIPVSAGALTTWLIQTLAKKKQEDVETLGEMLSEEQEAKHWWVPIVRTLMRFLESYLDQIDPVQSSPSENGRSVDTKPAEKRS